MIRLSILAATLAFTAIPALAQDNGPLGDRVGEYVGSGEGELSAEITHLQNDVYAISITTTVPMENDIPGCGGGIDGEMIMTETGGNFFVENEFYEQGSTSPMTRERYCEIGVTFDEDGFLNLEERNGCISYHGAACGFTGQLLNVNAIN
ncbi:hypothetical protein GCM10007913_17090 [Devosia yakushimensis]|uniref:Uncharacterized protein n=1 Tax=Devosia yakushimensis TaxID=470028 RepID=A0ABQ5UEJ0_9HYPH|nr:hypothetical protein [Devosia yakushimensis]GLQ09777.1 hypothetical protein GCM10007913_17090 [Devosia yakushimensis]